MRARGSLRAHLETLLAADPPRAGSLAVTIFGDVVSPQGGSVWLGSLVEAMAAFGLNARQVRTAVFRLAQDDWLEAEQRGRRSYYALTASGQRLYARAAARIYAVEQAVWDGKWTLVTTGAGLPARVRDELRKRLVWQGFGVLGGTLLAHPAAEAEALSETLAELEIGTDVVVWQARAREARALHELVRTTWPLETLGAQFRAFCERFEPLAARLQQGAACADRDAFVLRCLLIHDYRRILLRTIDLPAELLPGAWPGFTAMRLVQRIYRHIHAPASAHACAVLERAAGPLPPPEAAFYQRFGGLPRQSAAGDVQSARGGPALETC
ncbi:MAG: phenylacetic acid degradation operon negative regulatory protein PaaX [Gammaproteobacteria bacterium]